MLTDVHVMLCAYGCESKESQWEIKERMKRLGVCVCLSVCSLLRLYAITQAEARSVHAAKTPFPSSTSPLFAPFDGTKSQSYRCVLFRLSRPANTGFRARWLTDIFTVLN